jgi:ABC-type transporter Mla subunit MlaD
VPKQPDESRIPPAVGAIPVVGEFMKNANAQARWMQDLLEQNARLVAQMPDTLRAFNDSLERFNDTVTRLDKAVTRIDSASRRLTGPVERLVRLLDRRSVQSLPATLDALRAEAVPALRAATDTQRSVAVLQTTVDRMLAVVGELPGAGIVRRLAKPRQDEPPPEPPSRTSRSGRPKTGR